GSCIEVYGEADERLKSSRVQIHLDAHICTTPSDLYQKGVARVTQLQAMDIFGIAYSRALCGNMESRIPYCRAMTIFIEATPKMVENILVQLLTDRCQIAARSMDQSLVLHTCWALLREFGLWTPPSTLSNKTAAAARALDCHTANCIWSCIGMHYGAPPQQCR
ncbi:hypothetical protein N5P37_010783, partial [Trichoderma harzianum]